jgi:hypothetical protein
MRLLGAKKLARQLSDLPETVRDNVGMTIEKQVKRGVRVARTLVPVDSGQLKGWISGRVEKTDNGVYGIIDAAPDQKKAQQKARAVEFGRKKGNRRHHRRQSLHQNHPILPRKILSIRREAGDQQGSEGGGSWLTTSPLLCRRVCSRR